MAKKKSALRPPKRHIWQLFRPPFSIDLGVAVFVLAGGLANAIRAFVAREAIPGFLWLTAMTGGFSLSLTRVWYQFSDLDRPKVIDQLYGCLHVLHSQLLANYQVPLRVRLTVYAPTDDGTHLEQITEYVGDDSDNSNIGRKIPIGTGIVGLVYRTKAGYCLQRLQENFDDFATELVQRWGFREEDARQISPQCRSWIAVPLTNHGAVEGIVFADATVDGFFTPDNLQAYVVMSGCTGVATFIAQL